MIKQLVITIKRPLKWNEQLVVRDYAVMSNDFVHQGIQQMTSRGYSPGEIADKLDLYEEHGKVYQRREVVEKVDTPNATDFAKTFFRL